MKKIKVKFVLIAMALVMCVGAVPAIVSAENTTVYYKGTPVYWERGKSGIYSYSNVQSGRFEHRATANSDTTGWKAVNVFAKARDTIWFGTAVTYWDCRE